MADDTAQDAEARMEASAAKLKTVQEQAPTVPTTAPLPLPPKPAVKNAGNMVDHFGIGG